MEVHVPFYLIFILFINYFNIFKKKRFKRLEIAYRVSGWEYSLMRACDKGVFSSTPDFFSLLRWNVKET